jgi:hypothetical protein
MPLMYNYNLPEKQDTFCSATEANFKTSTLASSRRVGLLATKDIWAPFFAHSIAKYLPIPLEPPVI